MPTGKIRILWVKDYPDDASLMHTEAQAQGFYDTLVGTKSGVAAGPEAVDILLEEQQNAGSLSDGADHTFAEKSDIVYFSGHGDVDGPHFGVADEDDGVAKPEEVRLGKTSGGLRWLVLDACWCLKSGAIARWGPSFRGLHYILGFRREANDEPYRGKCFAEDLNAGTLVREAWQSACEETQEYPAWAYLRASKSGADTDDDHWIGKGDFSPNPTGSVSFQYVYVAVSGDITSQVG